ADRAPAVRRDLRAVLVGWGGLRGALLDAARALLLSCGERASLLSCGLRAVFVGGGRGMLFGAGRGLVLGCRAGRAALFGWGDLQCGLPSLGGLRTALFDAARALLVGRGGLRGVFFGCGGLRSAPFSWSVLLGSGDL